MKRTIDETFLVFLIVTTWIAGVVIANGYLKILAIFIPFYSWYLLIEMIMKSLGWII